MIDRSWLAALDHELAALGVPAEDRAASIVETEGFLADIGEAAFDHFGPPTSYAALLAEALAANGSQGGGEDGRVTLEASGISKHYRARTVMEGVDIVLSAGENVALIGANGVGKSTLLRVLAGIERPDAGVVRHHGTIGYSPQAGGLDPYLNPAEHVALFGAARGLDRMSAQAEGRRLADQLGWSYEGAGAAGELSGGTQQKLRVITAMIGEPDVLLLDEPYQGMDAESTRRFWELMWSIVDDGRSVLVSSHVADALARVHRVIDLDATTTPQVTS